jgi:hypothetical protein
MNKTDPVGTHIRIEPFDHCVLPSEVFPLRGKVVRRLHVIGGADNWFLVELEEPFEYQKKIGEPYRFRLSTHDKVIMRSRWQDHEVGEQEETSVFLLLSPSDLPMENDFFDPEQCDHASCPPASGRPTGPHRFAARTSRST